jgi:hypothetical protein
MKAYVLLYPDYDVRVHSVHKTLDSADSTMMEWYRTYAEMLQMYEADFVE